MGKRILYIDQLKGVAIFCVIVGHIYCFTYKVDEGNYVINNLITSFHIPLFFLLSGLVAKQLQSWNFDTVFSFLKKKFISLIFPFLFCGGLYTISLHKNIFSLFTSGSMHLGYWFTFVLFQIFVLFLFGSLFIKWCRKATHSKYVDLVVYGFMYVALELIRVANIIPNDIQPIISYAEVTHYFLFFIIGFLVKHYGFPSRFKTSFFTLALIFFVITFNGVYHDIKYLANFASIILMQLSGVYIICFLINKYAERIPFKEKLADIGSRSLDIYVLHYFLMNFNLSGLKELYIINGVSGVNISLELAISIGLASIVLVFTLLLSTVIRSSPLFSLLLLGRMRKKG